MNLLGKLDLVMLLFPERIIMHYNFVQVLVFKNYKRCKLTPNKLKPLPLVLASSLSEEPNKVGFTQKGFSYN